MVTHTATVELLSSEIDRINRLLSIPSLEEMSDEEMLEAGAEQHHCEGVMCVSFDDGSTVTYDLCSGGINYFDDVVWTSADNTRSVMLDCMFELDDFDFTINKELYSVKILRTN